MQTYARLLFGTAAAFNFAVGLALIFFRDQLGPTLDLQPVTGADLALSTLTGALVILFGAAYVLVAFDPLRYRPFIVLAAFGKLAAFACVAIPWLGGDISSRLPTLAAGDVIYAILFLDFVRRSRRRPSSL